MTRKLQIVLTQEGTKANSDGDCTLHLSTIGDSGNELYSVANGSQWVTVARFSKWLLW